MKTYKLRYFYKNRFVLRFVQASSEDEARERAPKNAKEVTAEEFAV